MSKDSLLLFLLQLLCHVAIIPMVLYGTATEWIIVILVYIIVGCFGITMTYHRRLAHNSWKSPTWFEYFGTFAGMYGLVGSPIAWACIHRQHHHHTDDQQDPHSPHKQSWWKVQFFSMFYKPEVRYGKSFLRDKFLIMCHRYYFQFHLAVIVFWLIVNPFALIYAYAVPATIMWTMGSSTNTLCHLYGYENFKLSNHSKNNLLLGYFEFGEGWHNNHHSDPTNPYFGGRRWWEFDLGYFFIKLLRTGNG